jgi:DNA recombination protein RmuC
VRQSGSGFRGAIVRAILNKVGTFFQGTAARAAVGGTKKPWKPQSSSVLAFCSPSSAASLGSPWAAIRGSDTAALLAAQMEAAKLEQECRSLRAQAEQLEAERTARIAELRRSGEEAARLTERVDSLTRQAGEQGRLVRTVEGQRDVAAAEAKTAAAEVARLKEREKSLSEKVAEQVAQLADQQSQLTSEFENIANRILKANATELSESSQKALAAVLDPLRERIQDFQKKVETAYDSETREVLSLKEQIRLMVETSSAIGTQADGLAKALRGDSQLLGRWGELALERILEAAGLTEGREYVSQGRGLGLKSDSGGAQKPDIVVMLPEGRTMIIDSKVPLTGYERLIAAGEQTERTACGDQFVRDVKGDIDGLAGKRYQENEKLEAHDCVLMFVPIEGALAAALTKEPELFTYAWSRRVVLVGPPTLLMTMRTVASIWRYELQGQNAQEIARLAGELCDKVSMSLVDLNGVAEKINAALAAHNDAVKRLSTGRGNALSVGERIRSLGVKSKRPMPAMLVDGIAITSGRNSPKPLTRSDVTGRGSQRSASHSRSGSDSARGEGNRSDAGIWRQHAGGGQVAGREARQGSFGLASLAFTGARRRR